MPLETLRTRLNQLKRRRAAVRLSTAWSAFALAVLWLVVSVFVVDWLTLMTVPQRLIAWLIATAVAAWAFWHYTRPWLGKTEDIVDVALLVEKHQQIDSDLVAALQFQQPEAGAWGSPQLESAVVNYVEEFSPSLNVFEGFTYRRFKRRLMWLAGTGLLVVVFVGLLPQHANAFLQRMFLGSARYPTDTTIQQIAINGETVFLAGQKSITITKPHGTPLNFAVLCNGTLPEDGTLRLTSQASDNQVEIALKRGLPTDAVMQSEVSNTKKLPSKTKTNAESEPKTSTEDSDADDKATFFGQLPRLVDPVSFQVFVGDTWSDPIAINVIPLPVVSLSLEPQLPAYASSGDAPAEPVREGTRQIAVVEGSSVVVNLKSTKPLKTAWLSVGEETFPLKNSDSLKTQWTLAGASSPLHQIRDNKIQYAIQVEDEDGLRLETPIEGSIRIRADRKPRIQPPDLVTQLVLPKAKPTVDFQVSDDYGLSRLAVHIQVERKNKQESITTGSAANADSDDPAKDNNGVDHITREMLVVPTEDQPKRVLSGRYALVLESFKLEPGDELKVTLEAFDYRGDFPAQSSFSEPLVLKVTDKQGILLGILNMDERSAQSIDQIIEITSGDTK